MRTALLASPLALLSAACALQEPAATPAAAVLPLAPPPRASAMPREQALHRWQLPPTDPWAAYAKYTLLTAPGPAGEPDDVASLDAVVRAGHSARALAAGGLPAGTLWIVDMRGAASVAFGAALSHAAREPVSLVPTFHHWPAENAVIPAEETLAALVAFAPRMPDPGETGTTPVFLLDSWRLAYRYEDPGDGAYDNRYMLSPADLPDATTLRARGIARVAYVVQSLDGTSVEEDDLHARFLEWQRSGVHIALLDVDRLLRPVGRGEWEEVWRETELDVEPRVTVLEQPAFYELARGGFGGPDAAPAEPIGVGWDVPVGWGGTYGRGSYGGHGACGRGGHGGGG